MQPANETSEQIAREILQSGVDLPPLPAVFSQLLAMSRQPEDKIDINKFTKLVQTDPALTSRILQLANSSYYGSLQKTVNLRLAIMRLGLQETISTVSWMLCQKALPRFPVLEGFSDIDYWAHSWACATANRMLGHPDLKVNSHPGDLYIAGLLHGIGRLILALHKREDFRQCLINAHDFSQPLEAAELEFFGTTEACIAGEVLKSWQFPEPICSAVRYCRNPEDAPPAFTEIAALTQFAYYLASTSGVGNNGDEFSFDFTDTYLCKKETSQFADPAFLGDLVATIHQALRQKSPSFTGVQATTRPRRSRQAESVEAEQAASLSPTRKKPGRLSRALLALRRLFSRRTTRG